MSSRGRMSAAGADVAGPGMRRVGGARPRLDRVMHLKLSDEVAAALADARPVVALESTIISHGLPRPRNLGAAREFEALLRDAGVTPATIAVLDGVQIGRAHV